MIINLSKYIVFMTYYSTIVFREVINLVKLSDFVYILFEKLGNIFAE